MNMEKFGAEWLESRHNALFEVLRQLDEIDFKTFESLPDTEAVVFSTLVAINSYLMARSNQLQSLLNTFELTEEEDDLNDTPVHDPSN